MANCCAVKLHLQNNQIQQQTALTQTNRKFFCPNFLMHLYPDFFRQIEPSTRSKIPVIFTKTREKLRKPTTCYCFENSRLLLYDRTQHHMGQARSCGRGSNAGFDQYRGQESLWTWV